jgi:hypothetical protein
VTLLIVLLIAGLVGCKTTQTRSALMEKTPGLAQTPEQVRVQVRSLVPLMLGIMESAADDVLESTSDPEIRAAALHFKADGIPTMYRALFQPDPVAAVLDAWVLVAQMRTFFEAGKGREMPESVRAAALAAVDRMDAELERFVRAATRRDDISRAREFVTGFAEKHPIDSFATRHSTEELLAALTAREPLALSASIGSLEQDIADVVGRLDVLSGTMPKQARWEAELLVYDLLGVERAASIPADLAALNRSVLGAASTIEGLPELVTVQREAVLAALRAEIGTLEQIVHEQRLAAQGFVTAERSAALEQLTSEREVVMAAIVAERFAAIEALRAERVAATADLERLSIALVDRLFLRVAQLLGGLVVAVILGVAVVRLTRRRA